MTDKRDITPPEDSIPLRVVVFLMTFTCIVSSCLFIKTAWPVWVLSLALAGIGSVVSYQYRHDKQSWMQWVVVVGVLAVGANSASEFMDPANGTMEFWGPMVHFIAGIFALHTFDLKSRSDINLSAMLGALILCFLSPVARSFYFGLAVFSYISLGTVMLYFDCMSRTLHNWLSKPMQPAPVVDVANTTGRRKPRGNTYLTVALLPLLSLLGFLLVPRMDNFVDNVMSALKHMDATSVLRFMPNIAPQPIDIPHNEFESPIKKKIEMNKKKRELENNDEVDKELQKMGVDKRKEVKAKEKDKVEKEKAEKSEKKPPAKKSGAKKGAAKKHGAPPKPPKKSNSPPGARPKTNRPKDNLFVGDKVDLDTDAPDSEVLLYRTTATRLFYSRHSVFDDFDGRFWKRSKAKLKVDEVEIKDKNAIPDKKPANSSASGSTDPETPGAPELTAEQQADKELHLEKLAEQAKGECGFGADMRVDYICNNPPKGEYHLGEAAALHVPAKLPGIGLKQDFVVQNNVDNHIPNAWVPQDLHYLGDKITVDDYGQITTPGNIKKGTKFSVNSQWPVYNVAGMRVEKGITADREKEIRDRLENYLQLPEDLDPDVLDMADQMAGKTGNWFAIAERLSTGVKTGRILELDREDYEPAEDRTADFLLERKAGTHKDFTSAFIVLCRCEGLPARFVYGFTPGSFNKELGVQDVRMNDAQSWAEVFIPDYGWVPFDATPSGVMPGVKRDEGNSLWSLFKWLCEKFGINVDEGLTPKMVLTMLSIGMATIFLIVGIVLGILMFIKYRRNRNRKPWEDEAWKIWQNLARDFKKARMERMASETPTEFVDRIRHIVREQRREGTQVGEELPDALSDFFVNYKAVHFGNKEGLGMLKEQAVELRKLVKANHGGEKASNKRGGGSGGGGTSVGAVSGGPKMSAKQQRQAEAASQAVRGKR